MHVGHRSVSHPLPKAMLGWSWLEDSTPTSYKCSFLTFKVSNVAFSLKYLDISAFFFLITKHNSAGRELRDESPKCKETFRNKSLCESCIIPVVQHLCEPLSMKRVCVPLRAPLALLWEPHKYSPCFSSSSLRLDSPLSNRVKSDQTKFGSWGCVNGPITAPGAVLALLVCSTWVLSVWFHVNNLLTKKLQKLVCWPPFFLHPFRASKKPQNKALQLFLVAFHTRTESTDLLMFRERYAQETTNSHQFLRKYSHLTLTGRTV